MNKLPLQFHPDARVEAFQAYDWYAERNHQAGDAFHDELQDAGRAIQAFPDRWSFYLFGTRRSLMKRFPFVIVYRVVTDRIEIIAIAHGKRRPGYWKRRIASE